MVTKIKRKIKRNIPQAVIHVHASYNNTIITVSDPTGNAISWASAGSAGFKGARKGTPFAAQMACEKATLKAVEFGLKQADIVIKGQGPGRETAIRALQSTPVRITSIKDITGVPYNGCRPPKRRRI